AGQPQDLQQALNQYGEQQPVKTSPAANSQIAAMQSDVKAATDLAQKSQDTITQTTSTLATNLTKVSYLRTHLADQKQQAQSESSFWNLYTSSSGTAAKIKTLQDQITALQTDN